MRDFSFRAYHKGHKEMILSREQGFEGDVFNWLHEGQDIEIMQYTGLKDKNGVEICVSDVFQFDNGDKFVVKMEDWLEVYCDWIGDPECEDQARDLYRISESTVIGNIYQHEELLEQ